MIETLSRFLMALNSMPTGWRLWVMGLVIVNMIAPMSFIGRREARVVIAVFLAQGTFMLLLFRMQGFTRLLGLAHIGWIGLIYYLWTGVDWKSGERSSRGMWLRALVAMDAISLSIDIVDIFRFFLENEHSLR